MSEKVSIPAEENHVMQRIALLKFFRKERGETKTDDGYMIPLTTYEDIEQMVKWWDREFMYAVARDRWDDDPARELWRKARKKIANDSEGASPQALYPDSEWFWNFVLLKLAIYLEGAKTKPSSTDLLVESFKETIVERVEDVGDFFGGVGDTAGDVFDAVKDAADAVADAGSSTWSGLKIAAIVSGGLVGAAIVLPPVIRAIRD